MRIGILTYHFSINCGAVLQCFALQEFYRQNGFPVEVINYISPVQKDNVELYRKTKTPRNIAKNILLTPFHEKRLERVNRFHEFQERSLICSRHVSNRDELASLIENDGITHIIVGSDQVWNPHIDDFDPAFFLDFDSQAHKLGYAISLGKASQDDLLPYIQCIEDFERFSMREISGQKIVAKLGLPSPPLSVDPTLLLDRQTWSALIKDSHCVCDSGEYILCYFLNRNCYKKNYEAVMSFAKSKGMPVFTLDFALHKNAIRRNSLLNCGPIEFLEAINNAKYLFTDSFHGTVFSILSKRNFISIDNKDNNGDTRRFELLKLFGLSKLFVPSADGSKVIEEIDYEQLPDCIGEIEESKQFALSLVR